eukprot:RCo032857
MASAKVHQEAPPRKRAKSDGSKEPVIDESLYNRQVYVIGMDAMKKMSQTSVLVSGLTGLGCEIAKNLILAGVASVTLHDPQVVGWSDLASNFYFSVADVGKNRVKACIGKLSELNGYVRVTEFSGDIANDVLRKYQVVVFVDRCTTLLSETDMFCHTNGIKFVAAESRGVAGVVFCDFGKDFEIVDTDGEEPVTCLITAVTQSVVAAITVHDDNRHNLEDGQQVLITDIEGPSALNGEWKVKVTGPYTFTIEADTTKMPLYIRGGYVKPIKPKLRKDFLPLKEALDKPEAMTTDFSKEDMPNQLHVFFQALHQYMASHGDTLPESYNQQQADEIVALARQVIAKYPSFGPLKEKAVSTLALTCSGNLNPMAAFLGGFVAQEVLKACSGKFTPLSQWLYYDALEILPDPLPSPESCKPTGTRYDGQIAVLGRSLQELLTRQHCFVVGAGALGCEYLKNFAMMGLGCSPDGEVIVTDMDNIEKTNLSRQFLFRSSDIGHPKSAVACRRAKEMNPALNIRHMTDKVAPETEHIFDDSFWEKLDGVTNALDNVQARLFVDSKCVYYRKPLLESGTLGTKGNVQVVLPFKTESYGASRDPPEKTFPVCTLKNFPNAIEHTIQWARDAFEGLFKQTPEDANAYLTRSDFLQQLEKEPSSRVTTLENVFEALVKSRPRDFKDCVYWGRCKFDEFFNNQIQQLLYNFPVDTITNSGERFWSGPKRPPVPVEFDVNDPTHFEFVAAAANLRAGIYGIPAEPDARVAELCKEVRPPPFTPKRINIQVEENEKPPEDPSVGRSAEDIIPQLPPPSSSGIALLRPVEFEKDDDTNFHMQFIAACSNLRARNYRIPEADRARTKQIAGKIIPAMVTTTALVTGLACFEWYKLIQGKPAEAFKNAFVNLALPFVTLSEPVPPATSKYGNDVKWTLWDRFDVDLGKDVTLQELLKYFMDKHKLEISIMSCGASIIYSFFGDKAKVAARLRKPVSEVVKEVSKTEFSAAQKYINMEICCTYEDEDCEVPYVRYRFRGW